MNENPSGQPSENSYPPPTSPYPPSGPVGGYSQPPADPVQSGAQLPYSYPPPPPPNQTWPPPPGGVYQAPMSIYPTQTNAAVILVFGILSIVFAWMCDGIGGICGVIPWVMGNMSLKAINQGLANPMERGMVNGGRICGIVGTVLGGLLLLFMAGVMLFSVIASMSGH